MGSLRLFVEVAWPILEPATPFLPNWHIDYVCEDPRSGDRGRRAPIGHQYATRDRKSLLVSVLWPCWEWAQRPSTRWLFVSYAESLAGRLSLDRRRLLTSERDQRYWGHQVRLTRDQNAKREFHTTRRGVMLATSVGGSVTGKGGGWIVIDDPHNPMQAESDLQRAHAIDFLPRRSRRGSTTPAAMPSCWSCNVSMCSTSRPSVWNTASSTCACPLGRPRA